MHLTEFTEQDFLELYNFMRPIWLETYGHILSAEHLDFLLTKYFSVDGVKTYRDKGYQYRKIDDVGVLVYVDRGEYTYMDKLYLTPNGRGKGYPKQVFDYLLSLGKDVVLNANQRNERAVQCYLKNGFVIEKEEVVDLGNGLFNPDYVMRKKRL